MSAHDFRTSDEEAAFNKAAQATTFENPTTPRAYEAHFWLAARNYFESKDTEGSTEGPAPDDQRLREVALHYASGYSPDKMVERAKEYLSFLKGEEPHRKPLIVDSVDGL